MNGSNQGTQSEARSTASLDGHSTPDARSKEFASFKALNVLSIERTAILRALWNLVRVLLLVAGIMTLGLPEERAIPTILGAAGLVLIFRLLYWVERSRVFLLWSAYILGIVLFTHLRAIADETIIATKYLYVIEIEQLLFLGRVPGVWLQERFHELGTISLFDTFMVWVHLSYFFFPHLVAVGLAVWNRRVFSRYIGAILATYYLGLVIYFLVPTSPPWLSGIEGHLPDIARIVQIVGAGVSIETYEQGHRVVGSNDVAAMPSLHFAITAVIVFAHWHMHWILRAIAVTYLFLMGLALVYLGEHYVTDLIVGFTVAAAGWWASTQLVNRYLDFQVKEDSAKSVASSAEAN